MLRIQRNYGRSYVLPESVLPSHESHKYLANRFMTFFSDKITKIRDSFSSTDSFRLPAPPDIPTFDSSRTVSDVEIHKAIMKSPTKSCLLDPWPSFLVKECLNILLPSITKLVNLKILTRGSLAKQSDCFCMATTKRPKRKMVLAAYNRKKILPRYPVNLKLYGKKIGKFKMV